MKTDSTPVLYSGFINSKRTPGSININSKYLGSRNVLGSGNIRTHYCRFYLFNTKIILYTDPSLPIVFDLLCYDLFVYTFKYTMFESVEYT